MRLPDGPEPTEQFFPRPSGADVRLLASGKLALLLAVPAGYASPVFPPAGIAVTGMLIGGWVTLPSTFLGSLLLNV